MTSSWPVSMFTSRCYVWKSTTIKINPNVFSLPNVQSLCRVLIYSIKTRIHDKCLANQIIRHKRDERRLFNNVNNSCTTLKSVDEWKHFRCTTDTYDSMLNWIKSCFDRNACMSLFCYFWKNDNDSTPKPGNFLIQPVKKSTRAVSVSTGTVCQTSKCITGPNRSTLVNL